MQSKEKTGLSRLLRWGDVVVIAAVLLLTLVSLFFLYIYAKPGGKAVITTPDGVMEYPLDQDRETVLTGRNGIRVIIHIEEGWARFQESGCPDRICVNTGWLSKNGQSAACLPAGIILRIEEEDSNLDYVAN